MKIRLLLATSLITLTTVSYSQVPNGDMEDWTVYTSVASGISCDVPDGWDVPDKIAADLGISDRNCERNSDNVHGGSFAAKLTTKTLDVLGTPLDVPGTITTGVISFDFVTFTPAVAGGAAISSNYDQLGGFYQYAPSGSDTMNIAVLMFLGTDTVGAGQYRDPNTSAGYVSFVCPITYFAPVIPDKMQITITSSGGFTSLVPGSVLWCVVVLLHGIYFFDQSQSNHRVRCCFSRPANITDLWDDCDSSTAWESCIAHLWHDCEHWIVLYPHKHVCGEQYHGDTLISHLYTVHLLSDPESTKRTKSVGCTRDLWSFGRFCRRV